MTYNHIVLLHPDWLWLAVLLPILAAVMHFAEQKYGARYRDNSTPSDDKLIAADVTAGIATGKVSLRHPLIGLISQTKPVSRQRRLPYIVLWLVLVCLMLSLSQPVRVNRESGAPSRQRDIVFIVDTSLSMVLRDYELNGQRVERINVLKYLLTEFVSQLQGERIGIIVFGDSAQTLVPLTRDQRLLTSMITRVSAGMLKRQNAMGDAIALAVHQASQDKTDRNRILVLFTDAGDDTGKVTPMAAARLAAETRLPVYTVAVGAATDQAAEQQYYSGLLYQPVDTPLLQAMSRETGAKSYQVGDSNMLQKAITDITQNQQQPAKATIHYTRQALYFWPLLAGLCLLTGLQVMLLRGSLEK